MPVQPVALRYGEGGSAQTIVAFGPGESFFANFLRLLGELRERFGLTYLFISHDLAVVQGPNGGLHHSAFWLDDWDEVRDAADVLAHHGIQVDVGPTRHGITRGSTIYFFDPLGTRNEVFTGGYWVDPGSEPITWTEAEMGRALFYYDGAVDQRYLTVHS